MKTVNQNGPVRRGPYSTSGNRQTSSGTGGNPQHTRPPLTPEQQRIRAARIRAAAIRARERKRRRLLLISAFLSVVLFVTLMAAGGLYLLKTVQPAAGKETVPAETAQQLQTESPLPRETEPVTERAAVTQIVAVTETEVPETEAVTEAVYPAPDYPEALTAPEGGWSGWITALGKNVGDITIYGQPLEDRSGLARDRVTGSVGGKVTEREAVDDSYFDDAVFIGNSLAVGLQKSGKLQMTYYASIGLSVYGFFEKSFVPAPEESYGYITVAEQLARHPGAHKYYLMLGINELGWPTVHGFITQYEYVLDAILMLDPDAVIYVQEILPMNEAVYATSSSYQSYFTNARINEFNEAIRAMAEERNVFLLTPGDVLAENGILPASATFDGIHLTADYYGVWAQYLRTHAVDEYQYADNSAEP